MFTFIGPVHLAILTHHNKNIHNNYTTTNNNTVSARHKQKSLFCLPTPMKVALYVTILYHALQGIYTIQKATLSNKFL